MDPAPGVGEEPGTTRRGGLLVCLFGLALMAGDIGLVALFWHTHTRMFGLILVLVMLLRPQGLLPSRVREQELAKGISEEAVFDLREGS